jgi:hypothetical protein
MNPDKEAVEVLVIEDPHYPEGLYACVDYDYDPDTLSEYRKLKWVCKDEQWQALLNITLGHITPEWDLNHYMLDSPNPPLTAAKVAAQYFRLKILSEGVTHETGPIFPGEAESDGG